MESTTFDPGRHLSKVNGNDYLEVKWRLVWLRDQHPDATIDTEMASHQDNQAVFRARVTLPNGASATGWGSEDASGFSNYIEKAETKAIGRALAALGFGTQFCPDFDYGADVGRVVDAPVALRSTKNGRSVNGSTGQEYNRDQTITDRQRNLIYALSHELKLDAQALDEVSQEVAGRATQELSRRDASNVIEALKERRQGSAPRLKAS